MGVHAGGASQKPRWFRRAAETGNPDGRGENGRRFHGTFLEKVEKEVAMVKVSILMAPGLEEVECLAVADILRRGGVQVELVSVSGERVVTGSHRIATVTDRLIEECDFSESDVIFLPGGVPGVPNLAKHPLVAGVIQKQAAAGKRLAAICAAPAILGKMGLFAHTKFTCYPGWQEGIDGIDGAEWTGDGILTSGNLTTGRGLGFAVDFGLELLRVLLGEESAEKVKKEIQHPESVK